jgi:hypothetical protein
MENWIVIDNTILGKSSNFDYQNGTTENILTSLPIFLKDETVVAVIYNKITKFCYLRSGYDLTNNNDYLVNNDYTVFIVKSRIKIDKD